MTLLIPALLLALGIGLVVFAMPKQNGKRPAFFDTTFAFTFYPVACLGCIVVGAALLISNLG